MIHPVVGHEAVRRSLARARAGSSLPAALLVMGPRGIGKQRMALWLGQLILCDAPDADGPCGTCRHCRRTLRLEHPDLHWFFPLVRPRGVSREKLGAALEDARLERIAHLREEPVYLSYSEDPTAIYLAAAQELRRKAGSRPAEGREQIFIIADAERLVPQESSQEAANSLLKLLEEPPPNTRFILTSSEPGSLLDTIRSRTVPLLLPSTTPDEAAAFLAARGTEPADARRAAALAGGSIGMALGFLPDGSSPGPLEELRTRARDLVRAALSPNPGDGYLLALEFKVSGARALAPLLDFVDLWLRDLAAAASGAVDRVVNRESAQGLAQAAEQLSLHPAAVSRGLPVVEAARREARGNVNPQLIVAGMIQDLRKVLLESPLRAAGSGR